MIPVCWLATKKDTKVATVAKMVERTHGKRAVARQETKGNRKSGKGESRARWTCGVEKEATTSCTPLISRRDKQKVKKAASLVNLENTQNSNSK